jgi:TolB-like protein
MRSTLMWCGALVVLASATATARAGELRVAVMEFTNAGAGNDAYDLAALGKGLQSMITTDLSQLPAFKVVERERLRDIQNELKLQRGKAVDPATAAKIGKLAGASHLFSGSFTVVGEKMRIDGRLVSVTDGSVVFAEQTSGAKDAFFELEQALVKKIVEATNVKLAPKERAQLARPQTADFEAFKKFSVGLANFDDKKYDEALKSLKEATELDKEFKLAALTLDEYERLAGKLRARADDVERGNLDALRREKSQAIKERLDVIAKLWPIAEGKAKVAASTADPRVQRLFATCRLMHLYHHHLWDGGEQIPDDALARAGLDPFILERTGDALARRYWAEAPELFPKVPIVCASPLSEEKLTSTNFDKDFAYAVGNLEDLTKGYGLNDLLRYHTPKEAENWFLQKLHIDRGERLRAAERIWKIVSQRLEIPPTWRVRFEQELGVEARDNAALEQSTAHFASIGKIPKASDSDLRNAADEVQKNKLFAQALADKAIGKHARELMVARRLEGSLDYWQRMLGGPMNDDKREYLKQGRTLTLWTDYVLFGNVPAWPLSAWEGQLYSGPRTDRLRTDEIRYLGENAKDGTVVVTGPQPRAGGDVKVRLVWRIPDDFHVRRDKGRPLPPRAAGGVVVGLRNVGFNSTDALKVAPTRGYAVIVTDKAVQLVEIKRTSSSSSGLEWNVREEKPIAALASVDQVDLEVSAAGGTIDAKVNGQKVSFKSPTGKEGTEGLIGLATHGTGYVGFADLKLSTRR